MESNKNIFCVSNPAKILDGLWRVMTESGVPIPDILLFVPSRRAARSVEKMIAEKSGGAAILPRIVPLGEGVDDIIDENYADTVCELERVVAVAYLISGLPNVRNIGTALPIARTLITMQDYLENSGIDIKDIDWKNLVDEKYAKHFQDKADLLNILARASNEIFSGRETDVKRRNRDAYAWCDYVQEMPKNNSLIIVCGSTASVPTTRKLMSIIAKLPNGRIILPGKISGVYSDFELDTNPYNAEYKFLNEIGVAPENIQEIDVGKSSIDFMNRAFGNVYQDCGEYDLSHCHLIAASRESEEAAVVADIANRAIQENKSVLVITPDSAGNQRLMTEFDARGIVADFSGGQIGTMTPAGRAILNILDDWIESGANPFQDIYYKSGFNLFETVANIVENFADDLSPHFVVDDDASIQIWNQIKKLSDCLNAQNIRVDINDARAFIADAMSGVRVRRPLNDSAPVAVLGTIESRMQTADVIILTGLNEGMFPATGYENPWLPRAIANKIGLPSPNHKVSLMALDFMNLSCGPEVYWTRSKTSGGVQTQESRFLSRVIVARGAFDESVGADILNNVRSRDSVPFAPLDYTDPVPPADWTDVFVTEIEKLIHNPYVFYVYHILRLRKIDDYWVGADARDFGNLVHDTIEHAEPGASVDYLVSEMDARAREKLGRNNLIFYFWHRRFVEIALAIVDMLSRTPNAESEVEGSVKIAGRTVRARADRIWQTGVLDIKTGAAPNKNQLMLGNMPQLPLEAYMLKNGGFTMYRTNIEFMPTMEFLQLRAGDVRPIQYDAATTNEMINAAVAKVTEMFNIYSAGGAGYEYRKTGDTKYKEYDDFARADERD
ncbi:MAG: PD-(D/E)XK nuclease family protein [Alphaproteobacteria bacterium]|nr:PD-(D/E)XK nuclease family protein [Alphaproteobacteria bacterium]